MIESQIRARNICFHVSTFDLAAEISAYEISDSENDNNNFFKELEFENQNLKIKASECIWTKYL